MVRQRKNYVGRRIADIMDLVSNGDSLWDFV